MKIQNYVAHSESVIECLVINYLQSGARMYQGARGVLHPQMVGQ